LKTIALSTFQTSLRSYKMLSILSECRIQMASMIHEAH